MIKIAIIGTGGIAEWHVNEFQKNNNSEVVAACDISKDRLNNFCNKFLDLGPAIAAPAHCSVVETTFTFKSGHTNCK